MLEVASLPRLEHLGATGLPRLTDQAAFFLAEHAFELEQLHLSYCVRLSLDGVRAVLRRLTKLGMTGLTMMTLVEVKGRVLVRVIVRVMIRIRQRTLVGTQTQPRATNNHNHRKPRRYRLERRSSGTKMAESTMVKSNFEIYSNKAFCFIFPITMRQSMLLRT